MNKYLLILSTFIFISCDTALDPNILRIDNLCGESCMQDLDWEILTNYEAKDFPSKVSNDSKKLEISSLS